MQDCSIKILILEFVLNGIEFIIKFIFLSIIELVLIIKFKSELVLFNFNFVSITFLFLFSIKNLSLSLYNIFELVSFIFLKSSSFIEI